ncbi:glycosyltransferase [Shinella sp. CPCC 101442]|uniref:glycosyltransferase n=1 Tax=Shinella sp. CPCC 101442 TaxID=2932265 RepID=UPI0021520A93|nr:glycosyltransferase family 2 protein [Shinella sp. CPCC 101442]MCR6502405.1 glycosyltransferase [Shinella sp. CPCC 101442]
MQPQLTVIIPHLNEPEGNLRRCLLALDSQTAPHLRLQIIVVDNGSVLLPSAACADIPDVLLEREATPGPGPARNLGAMLAKSDLLAFVDADCVVEPGWAQTIVDTMNSRPDVDVVGGDIGILMANPARPTAIEAYECVYSYRAQLYVERHGYAATGNMAVRASVFRHVGPFGGIGTMEDTAWGQRATALGFKTVFLPEAKVLTPSCKSFVELARRWDRHVAHQFDDWKRGQSAGLAWFAACCAMAGSPVFEAFRVLTSNRISGARNRLFTLACLTRVRLYRAKRMLDVARRHRAASLVENWNREGV